MRGGISGSEVFARRDLIPGYAAIRFIQPKPGRMRPAYLLYLMIPVLSGLVAAGLSGRLP